MRVTVYLPDDLRERAAKAHLNLSALLRDAVERELHEGEQSVRTRVHRKASDVEVTARIPVEMLRRLLAHQ